MEGESVAAKKPEKAKKRAIAPIPEGMDVWRIPSLAAQDVKGALLEDSSFATLFPKYREKYIKEVIGIVQKELSAHGIKVALDLAEGSLTVHTSKKTWDPYSIVKARDVIKLLARSVPYQVALRVMQDETYCDIIKIKNLVGNKEKYVKRRARLIGPGGNTLKCLELLTDCYILAQGSTVCAVGNYRQLKQVRRIVEDVMRNVHPLYHIKEMMIKRELEKDEKLKDESWEKFLPQFSKIRSVRRRIKKTQVRTRNPFPNPPKPRLEDLKVESGEYFLSEQQLKQKKTQQRMEKEEAVKEQRVAQRQKSFVPPTADEEKSQSKAPQKTKADSGAKTDVKALLKKFNIPSPSV